MFTFLHTYSPNPLAISAGWLHIYWYSLFMVIAIFVGIFVAIKIAKRYNFTADDVYDLSFYLAIFGIVGARLYAVCLFPHYYFVEHPLEIIQVWKGGLAIHGALIAGALTLFWYTYKKKLPFLVWADIIVLSVALGQAIGRWGNYFNQELFGTPTTLPWGIPIDEANRPAAYLAYEHFHPVFLYESVLNLGVFLVLLFLHWKRGKGQEARDKAGAGGIFLVYVMCYAVIRIAMEQFRTDTTPLIAGIRWPIVVSLLMIMGVFGFFILRYNNKKV